MVELTIEDENKVIDSYNNADFYAVLLQEFKPVGVGLVFGYAALYGLTFKENTVEVRKALVDLGLSVSFVYTMYQDFRRLRRALLAAKGYAMQEQRGGPGANVGVPPVVKKLRALQSV